MANSICFSLKFGGPSPKTGLGFSEQDRNSTFVAFPFLETTPPAHIIIDLTNNGQLPKISSPAPSKAFSFVGDPIMGSYENINWRD